MTPIAKLRPIAEAMLTQHAGAVDDRFFETFKPALILEMLDEIEESRGTAKPVKRNDYLAEFEIAYEAMALAGTKWRAGSTRPAALIQWKARIKAGATPADMIGGATGYARYCKATGCEVKQAQTFFGPGEHFRADWTITKADARKGQMHGSIGKQDFNAGVRPDGSF